MNPQELRVVLRAWKKILDAQAANTVVKPA